MWNIQFNLDSEQGGILKSPSQDMAPGRHIVRLSRFNVGAPVAESIPNPSPSPMRNCIVERYLGARKVAN